MKPKLTIGMAVFDDFNGVYFSVQALRLYHRDVISNCEIIVVDNNPKSRDGAMTKSFIEGASTDRSPLRYLTYTDTIGTSAPRNMVFAEARGNAVMCIDPHVYVEPNGLARLLAYYDEHPDTPDLLSGPMYYDNLISLSTHFADVWRSEMWGIWDTDPRGLEIDNPPFEIPAMGLGLFTCRKDAWLGFNPKFVGFGGEELYIHEKVRRAGGKNLCLPFLRWVHRFGRPEGVKYPLTRWNKVRNYVIGHQELNRSLDPVYEHFVGAKLMSQAEWDSLVEDSSRLLPKGQEAKEGQSCTPCGGGTKAPTTTLEQLYDHAWRSASDINEHCPKLRELASQCEHVTEFGMRHGASTVAILAGQPKRFITYDLTFDATISQLQGLKGNTAFEYRQATSLDAEIEPTDMLFIDTKHTADHLYKELNKHADKVRRWIVLHDTQIFGEHGEDGGPGLLPALRAFLRENSKWSVIYHTLINHGLTVISCNPDDKPDLPGTWEQVKNFTTALAEHVADGGKKVEREVMEARLTVCATCDQRVDDRCAACGCYLAEKASWNSSECPLGKWDVAKSTIGELPLSDVREADAAI